MVPDRTAHGEEVRPSLHKRAPVSGGDAADRDAGDLEEARPPGEDRRVGPVMRLLRRGREEGAEGDIIRAGLPRLHGEMASIVAGDSDLRGRPEQRPRLARIAVSLAEMDPVG